MVSKVFIDRYWLLYVSCIIVLLCLFMNVGIYRKFTSLLLNLHTLYMYVCIGSFQFVKQLWGTQFHTCTSSHTSLAFATKFTYVPSVWLLQIGPLPQNVCITIQIHA